MNYVVIVELRGFANISDVLSKELEEINVSSANIRSSIISILSNIINQIKANNKNINPLFENILGGDTWGFVFEDFDSSLKFCCNVLSTLSENLHTRGLFFIKPSISISCTENISIKERKLLDDGFVNAYKLADKGKAYKLYFHESLSDDLSAKKYFNTEYLDTINNNNVFNWKKYSKGIELTHNNKPSIYDIMFDENIMYLDNIEKTINNFIELQNRSKKIYIFGGLIDYSHEYFNKYLKDIVNLFHNKKVECTIINFIRSEMAIEKKYIIVTIFYKLMNMYKDKIAYSLYEIPNDLPIPTPYHIYDNQYIQFIMRKYIPHKDSVVAVSSLLIKSNQVCDSYSNEFIENFKKIKLLDNNHYDSFVKKLNIDTRKINDCNKIVHEYLKKE